MNNNLIEDKTFKFAIDTINIYKYLSGKNEFIMSKQILRSGTSIGANVKEGIKGQSKRDFLSKMYISLKEANETEYWIQLLIATGYLDKLKHDQYLLDCQEICRILHSIVKTTKENLLNC
ncbi:four helix bundle protein [Tissierella sp. P1]|uniref:Four helix bundle protein n=1 Tax=Tissierella carlieri TaxID=689904 RepID=A0ABT1SBX7_9FIRM|nr:four helix bundle protein [Tissierella sp. P1]MCQ4923993.1 four helix bundle protein [Tissierella carlieri]OZV12649.1 four helix bundle protein [Tissierella sp. P1]